MAPESVPSSRLVSLVLDASRRALAADFSELAGRSESHPETTLWPGEHYRLLTALAEEWAADSVVEVGTYQGASAIALMQATCVQEVTTFDVIPWSEIPGTMLTPDDFEQGLHQRVADLSERAAFDSAASLLSNASMLFIDGPKDGVFEHRFLDLLLSLAPRRDQLVVFDDIRVVTMTECWRHLPLDKMDATSLGHWSGTGVAIRSAGSKPVMAQ